MLLQTQASWTKGHSHLSRGNRISSLKREWKCLAAGQKSKEVEIIDVMSSVRKLLSEPSEVIHDPSKCTYAS